MKALSNIKQFDWNGVAQNPPFIVVRYLEEALACLKSEAFRMSVVASACALNYGLFFVLRQRVHLISEGRMFSLYEVIEEIKKYISKDPNTVLSEIPLAKCEKVNHFRNAFAHPEDYLILKPSSKPNVFTLKPKFNTPKDKEEAFIASQYHSKKKLKAMAEESLEVAYNSIREALKKFFLP